VCRGSRAPSGTAPGLPRLGKRYFFADLFRQRQPDVCFQLLDLHRNGGLREKQLLGSPCIAEQARNSLENLQLAQADATGKLP